MRLRFWLLCAVSIAGMLIGTSALAYSSHKTSAASKSPCITSGDCHAPDKPYCCCLHGGESCVCQGGSACQ